MHELYFLQRLAGGAVDFGDDGGCEFPALSQPRSEGKVHRLVLGSGLAIWFELAMRVGGGMRVELLEAETEGFRMKCINPIGVGHVRMVGGGSSLASELFTTGWMSSL